eukprot:COSAG03_NODE_2026_length_3206_cov_21.346315_1_plen_217_part_00
MCRDQHENTHVRCARPHKQSDDFPRFGGAVSRTLRFGAMDRLCCSRRARRPRTRQSAAHSTQATGQRPPDPYLAGRVSRPAAASAVQTRAVVRPRPTSTACWRASGTHLLTIWRLVQDCKDQFLVGIGLWRSGGAYVWGPDAPRDASPRQSCTSTLVQLPGSLGRGACLARRLAIVRNHLLRATQRRRAGVKSIATVARPQYKYHSNRLARRRRDG